jgi:hypothetical protein
LRGLGIGCGRQCGCKNNDGNANTEFRHDTLTLSFGFALWRTIFWLRAMADGLSGRSCEKS